MSTEILVTGAAGKTGRSAVRALIDFGESVRAAVRRDDRRAEDLRAIGAEVVVADLLDHDDVAALTAGVERAYIVLPPGPQLLEATTIFAHHARASRLDGVVNMSQQVARAQAPSPLSREHWLAERVLDWAEVGAIHIRPTLFTEMPLLLGGEPALAGRLALPWGDGDHSPITSADVGLAAAHLLAEPGRHRGARYELTGHVRVTGADLAEEVGHALGRSVSYEPVSPALWESHVVESGWPAYLAHHLRVVGEEHAAGSFSPETSDFERIVGRPATTPREYFDTLAQRDPDDVLAELLGSAGRSPRAEVSA